MVLFEAVQKLWQLWKKHVGAIFYFQLMLFGMFVLKTEWLVIRYQALLYNTKRYGRFFKIRCFLRVHAGAWQLSRRCVWCFS